MRDSPDPRAGDLANDGSVETYASVWDAIADTPAEAANLKLRSELMDQITAIIASRG
ncbi:hypothetical protein [Thiocapsa roseopersicina]|uniref:hypothetical protein n=1 Tax=Thiocapsa roseopersicina TaxID=1058 RepID=UPI001FE19878|nr:hypothetical protein [Thiocapsa roseopersicina]